MRAISFSLISLLLISGGLFSDALIVQNVFGQDRSPNSDLSGTWRLVESRNIRPTSPESFSKTLKISHREPELRIIIQLNENGRERSLEQIYFTDNRGETNRTFTENQSVNSRTRWRGNRLEIRRIESNALRSPTGETRTIRIEIREQWELSEDRGKLIRTTTVSSPEASLINEMSGDKSAAKEVFSRMEQ